MLIFSTLLMVTVVSFGSLIEEFVTAYASQSVQGQRVVVEQSRNAKIRYENIIRHGYNEIVNIMAPEPFEWAYRNGKSYVVVGNVMKLSPATIVDAEQRFVRILSASPTVVATSATYYQDVPAYKIIVRDMAATYSAVVLQGSFLLKYLKVDTKSSVITVYYDNVSEVPSGYVTSVFDRFRFNNDPPDPMEMYVWKLVASLNNAVVSSMNINGVSLDVVVGAIPDKGSVAIYIFDSGSKISSKSLVDQFLSKGYTSEVYKFGDIEMVFGTKISPADLKNWVKGILK